MVLYGVPACMTRISILVVYVAAVLFMTFVIYL